MHIYPYPGQIYLWESGEGNILADNCEILVLLWRTFAISQVLEKLGLKPFIPTQLNSTLKNGCGRRAPLRLTVNKILDQPRFLSVIC